MYYQSIAIPASIDPNVPAATVPTFAVIFTVPTSVDTAASSEHSATRLAWCMRGHAVEGEQSDATTEDCTRSVWVEASQE